MTSREEAIAATKNIFGQLQPRMKYYPGYMGDGAGAVYTARENYYWVRYPLSNSPAVPVYSVAASVVYVDGFRVIVGYLPEQPNLLQVIRAFDARIDAVSASDTPITPGTTSGYVPLAAHDVNHMYLGVDPVYVNWRQITPLGVFPSSGLTVQIRAGYIPRPGADITVADQTLDLTASIPAGAGQARYALISYDSTGAVVVTDGTINAGGLAALTAADIPDTPAGNWRTAAIALYNGQTEIVENHDEIDIYDLRFPEEQPAGSVSPSSIPLTNTHVLVGNASNLATDVAMSNDATMANTGALTLATVNSDVGSFTNANITVNAKGLITAAANGGTTVSLVRDDLSASCNGVQTIFSTSQAFAAGSTEVTLNGLMLRAGVGNSYVEDVGLASITLSTAPLTGDELLITFVASGTGAATITISAVYIATTGSDITGVGSLANPYATLAKALSVLPDKINGSVIIHIADGTYAESITIRRFTSQPNTTLKLQGNTTTPSNVVFSGTVTDDDGNTCGGLITGAIMAELEGLQIGATAYHGLHVEHQANVIIDRCNVAGTTTNSVTCYQFSRVEFQGNVTLSGWSGVGFRIGYHALATYTVAGTLTISGPGTTGIGVHIYPQSNFVLPAGSAVLNITITNVLYGFAIGLTCCFQHWVGTGGTITIDNASTPASSAGILATDCSSWSTSRPIVIDHFTNAYQANSVSYIESSGSRTITNCGSTSSATQNSVIYLP